MTRSNFSRSGESAQHAAQHSNQLLTVSKGCTPLKRVVSISDLVTQAAEFSLHGSNLRSDLDIQAGLWRSPVDPAQIEQVINALIINAREAMPSGGIVRVSARNFEIDANSGLPIRPGRYVKVQVADNGGGIEKRRVTKIFQ